jgi:hypothetical protein
VLHPFPEQRRISAGLLGVAPGTSAREARATFLRRLERADFLPSEAWCIGLLGLDPIEHGGGFRGALQARANSHRAALLAELNRFREQFWNLEPQTRELRWEKFLERSSHHPWLIRQVKALKSGLTIDANEFEHCDGMQMEIAGIIRDTFALAPIERANRQNAWIASLKSAMSWRLTARFFKSLHPRIAALDPMLLERLEFLDRDPQPPPRKFEPNVPRSNRSAYIVVIVIFFVCLGLLKWAVRSPDPRPAPTNPPAQTLPSK